MKLVCGLDEAGRGSLFGPVVVAGCVLPLNLRLPGLNDSKKLNSNSRVNIFFKVINLAVDYYVVAIGPRRIDKFNILQATMYGFKKCIQKLKADYYFVDGPYKPSFDFNIVAEPKADCKYHAVMAASVIAKVLRDSLVSSMMEKFPEFRLDIHKGYPTKLHQQELSKSGATIFHRKTFRLVYPVLTQTIKQGWEKSHINPPLA